MRCIVLVPSEDYKNNAGARIRYRRLEPKLAELGVELAMIDINTFDPARAWCDILIISKCYDARAIVLAVAAAERGTRIGVDLFDDYFSQVGDPRLQRLRSWLESILEVADFALCSTKVMAGVIQSYSPDLPVQVIDDPAPTVDHHKLATRLSTKLERVRQTRAMHIGWFGIGDNPYFNVGLSDLSARASDFARLVDLGFHVHLTVLTNSRALKWPVLADLSHLPVTFNVKEWSEEREQALLEEAFACLLPVSSAPFSIAKSLNRAVTALTSGCQIFSLGYPLYAELSGFIYRSPEQLADDVLSGMPRLRAKTLDEFMMLLEQAAGVRVAASNLLRFFEEVISGPRRGTNQLTRFIIHGTGTLGSVHKLQQSRGGLSVASPFSLVDLNFDVTFEMTSETGLRMLVGDRARQWLRPAVKAAYIWPVEGRASALWSDKPVSREAVDAPPVPPFLAVAIAPRIWGEMQTRLVSAFGKGAALLSENSNLPVRWLENRK